MWPFLTGVKPPPQKKAKLSETCRCMVRERKEKTRSTADMERQATLVAVHTKWHDDLQNYYCVDANFFSNGQPMIHQGNQIHGFGCPGFEIGTTWIFFLISSTVFVWPGYDVYPQTYMYKRL